MRKHFDPAKHPRGNKGTSQGGKFVVKGSLETNRPLNMYHISFEENDQSILEQGLKPTSQVGINAALAGTIDSYEIDGVFLANPSQAMVLANRFSEDGIKVSVFEVYLPKKTRYYVDELMPESSIVVTNVTPKYIRKITFGQLQSRKDEYIP